MGQGTSINSDSLQLCGRGRSKSATSIVTGESPFDISQSIYAYYPGLEQQLEVAFACHDTEGKRHLPYSVLEPVLRHILMQYGLIEYIIRFNDSQGALDPKYIQDGLRLFNIKLNSSCSRNNLSCSNFKYLAVIWLKKILDTYADDQATWTEKLQEEQEERCESYTKAMKNFEEKFVMQQAIYKQAIEDQKQQISDWNKVLENAQRTQDEVYAAEVRRMEEIKEREENSALIALQEQERILAQYTDQISQMAKADESGICFTYLSSCTPYGACVSAGAQEPTKRRKKPRQPKADAATRHLRNFLGCC